MINNILNIIENNKKYQIVIFLIILTSLSTFTIYRYSFADTITPGDDSEFHYYRLLALMKSLKDGSFPIYINNDALLQYGYAARWFYSDFILIPFAALANIIGVVKAYTVMFFTMSMLCGILTYISVNKVYKNRIAAFITAILYTFCLYRLQDLYDRSALSEAFSFTFVPLAFWGLYEIIKGDYKKWYIISIGFCLLIFTHVIATLLVFITSIIIIIIYYKDLRQEPKRLLYLILSGIVCILLSAYFLFPFFEQISSNSFYFEEGRMFAINFGNAKDDLIRIPTQNVLVGMLSIALPKITNLHFLPAIGLTLTFGIFLRFFIHEKDQKIKSIDIFVVLALVYITFSFDTLPYFFYVKKFFSTIQFTWRLYEISSFFLALGGGYYLSLLLQKNIRSVAALICLLGCVVLLITVNSTYYKYTREKPKTIPSQNIIIDKNSIAGLGLAEYLPIKVPSIEFIQGRNILLKTNNIETVTNNFERKNRATIFNVIVNKPDIIELPLIYYKGYSAKLNNGQITITESENGLIEIPINQSGKVHVEFTGTLIQKYSFYVTVISILLFCIYIFWYNRKNKKTNKTNHVNTII